MGTVAAPGVAVEARGLVKRYGERVAVAGVDFTVRRGECFALLGPNGAGKTSTLRMVQAVSAPSAGTLRVLGRDPVREGKAVRARLGVCPQEDSLDHDLSVRDNLLVYAGYFGIPAREARARASRWLDFLSLGEHGARRVPELSGGTQRRLALARALMNDPELLVLDEPSTGLDPQARHLLWEKLRELQRLGVTLLLTTHYLEEAERLADRLIVLDSGKVLAEGTPAELVRRHSRDEVVELSVDPGREEGLLAGLELPAAPVRAGSLLLCFLPRGSAAVATLLERARTLEVPCRVRRAALEDAYLELTGRELCE